MGRLNKRSGRSNFVTGLILLCAGSVLLAMNLGFDIPWSLWKYFPIPLIAFGLWGILSPGRSLDRVAGLWLLTNGLYCLVSVFGLFGLGWSTAWPIYIVALGIAVLARDDGAFICPRWRKDVDESHRTEPQVTNDR
jgi:Domain of unknown function (DUF5668)